MFRGVAIVFSFLALALLQAHNFIGHTHEEVRKSIPHHHHDNGSSHSHDDEPGKPNDSHSPEFGKYLLNKHEAVNFTACPSLTLFHTSMSVLDEPADQDIPLYYISPHETIPRHLVHTALHFRGPPSTFML